MTLFKIGRLFAAVVVVALMSASCGSSSTKSTLQQDSLAILIQEGDVDRAYSMAKEMANRLDELTPDETVTVLLAYLQAHNKEKGKSREIMREYLDIYEISTGDNPNDMEDAFRRALEVNPRVDFKKIAEEFRLALSEAEAYDELDDNREPAPIATPDKDEVTEAAPEAKAESATEPAAEPKKDVKVEPAELTTPVD